MDEKEGLRWEEVGRPEALRALREPEMARLCAEMDRHLRRLRPWWEPPFPALDEQVLARLPRRIALVFAEESLRDHLGFEVNLGTH